ncbi:MAG: RNA-directed DNA polymerase [Mangrovibacterium sp.]
MKRKNNLYELLCSEENIRTAFDAAKKGKRHYREVRLIEANPEKCLGELRRMLVSKTFVTSPYEIFTKTSGGKVREIHKLPFFPDRIVHHCIIQVVQQMWLNSLIRDTFSTIPGRGIHDGVRRMKAAMNDKSGTQYCLKLDIQKYYPSVDHDTLKTIIRRKIKDSDLLALLDNIIDSAPGIPIGNYVSQWFGNLYLSHFDHYCKEVLGCRYYYRYCDDVVVLADSKDFLHGVLIAMNDYLSGNLKLSIKSNYQVFPVDARGVDFLGYRFFHSYTLVRKRIVNEMKRKLNQPASLASYWGWLKHANSYRLTQKYFSNERKFKQSA